MSIGSRILVSFRRISDFSGNRTRDLTRGHFVPVTAPGLTIPRKRDFRATLAFELDGPHAGFDRRLRSASGALHRAAIKLEDFLRQTTGRAIDVAQKTEGTTKPFCFVVQEPNGCTKIDDAGSRASTRAIPHFEHDFFVFLHASKIELHPLVERESRATRTTRSDASFRSIHFPRFPSAWPFARPIFI
jgi:hypothetical protein